MKLIFIITRTRCTKVSASKPANRSQAFVKNFGWRRLAERQGFEPWVEINPTTVFETVPFNHSGISPWKMS
jgi:hypothetical protein